MDKNLHTFWTRILRYVLPALQLTAHLHEAVALFPEQALTRYELTPTK